MTFVVSFKLMLFLCFFLLVAQVESADAVQERINANSALIDTLQLQIQGLAAQVAADKQKLSQIKIQCAYNDGYNIPVAGASTAVLSRELDLNNRSQRFEQVDGTPLTGLSHVSYLIYQSS